MRLNKLFRGDTVLNKTMPERYRSCGIMSKLINGGNPAYIQRNGLIKSIQAHINPFTEGEKVFLSKSEFISFTEDENIAKIYCSYDKKRNDYFLNELTECEEYYETRYIFSLDISDCVPLNIEEGIYLLEYQCNPERRKSDGLNENVIEFQLKVDWYECEVCRRKERHKMFIIDSDRFLEYHKEYILNVGAFENAKMDKEWLILPRDYHKDFRGFSSMIPVSKIWNAKHYILKSEQKRDPYQFCIQGLIV